MNSKLVIFLFAVLYACAILVNGSPIELDDSSDISQENFSARASCVLPVEVGLCKASLRRWVYDADRQECVTFIYGGCMGNANNFKTKEECVALCRGV